jgi:hypothetical protein
MTELSPAAQAVSNAAKSSLDWEAGYLPNDVAAAALRGLVNEVMPERPLWTRTAEERTLYHEGRLDAAIRFRAEILAIADELEGQ